MSKVFLIWNVGFYASLLSMAMVNGVMCVMWNSRKDQDNAYLSRQTRSGNLRVFREASCLIPPKK